MCLKFLSGIGMIITPMLLGNGQSIVTVYVGLVFSNLKPFKHGLIPPAFYFTCFFDFFCIVLSLLFWYGFIAVFCFD